MSSSAASFFPTKMGTTISDFTIGDPARYRGSAAAFEVRRTKDARSAGREHSRELLKRLQFICPVNTAGSIDRGHARSKSNRRSHTAGWTRGAEFEPAPINKTQVMILTNAEMSERLFYYGPSGRQRPNRPKPAPPFPVPEHQPEDQGWVRLAMEWYRCSHHRQEAARTKRWQ